MDLSKTLQELYWQKDKIERAIASLECLRKSELEGIPTEERPKRRGRHGMSAGERQEVSERMKRYWAARREGGETGSEKVLSSTAAS
jgi:hypothetical protein